MKESNRLIKNTVIIAIGGISTKILSFFLLPLYTGILSTEDYGTFDYIVSLTTFIAPIISVLISESMFRFLIDTDNDVNKRKEVISESVLIVVIGSTLWIICAGIFFAIFPKSYGIPLVLYSLSMVFNWQISAVLRGIGKVKDYTIYNLLTSATGLVLNVITIAFLGWGLSGLYFSNIVPSVIWGVVYFIREKLWDFISFRSIRKDGLSELLNYSIPLVPNKLSWAIIDVSDRIIVTNTLGAAANGVYSISYKFPNLINTLYSFFYTAWTESSARVLAEGKEETNRFYNSVYHSLVRLLSGIILILLSCMPFVFRIMIKGEFVHAYNYVPYLMIGIFFSNIAGIYGGAFSAYKDTKTLSYSTVIAAAVNFLINILLIRYIGLYAAAGSTLVANVVSALIRRVKVRKYIDYFEEKRFLCLLTLTTVVCLYCYYSNKTIIYAIGICVATIFTIATNSNNIKRIVNMIKNRS